MTDHLITAGHLTAFFEHLRREERAPGTIEKYMRDVRNFSTWLGERPVTRETVAGWKEHLTEKNYAPVTINSMLAAVHAFFAFLGWSGCQVKYLKIQRQIFRESSRELTRQEYDHLVAAAKEHGKDRLALLMEAICATGVRVSEVRYLTVEAAQRGKAEISLKGKIRTILIPNKLSRKLLKYAKKQKIAAGEIFLTNSGKSLSRRQIWAGMKRICKQAGVAPSKVFPHNLRHLFAISFYKVCKDVVRLADVLGHSSINTTRIYLLTTGEEHRDQLERLGLVT